MRGEKERKGWQEEQEEKKFKNFGWNRNREREREREREIKKEKKASSVYPWTVYRVKMVHVWHWVYTESTLLTRIFWLSGAIFFHWQYFFFVVVPSTLWPMPKNVYVICVCAPRDEMFSIYFYFWCTSSFVIYPELWYHRKCTKGAKETVNHTTESERKRERERERDKVSWWMVENGKSLCNTLLKVVIKRYKNKHRTRGASNF